MTKARDKVAAIGDLLGVDAWSDRTRAALAGVAGTVRNCPQWPLVPPNT